MIIFALIIADKMELTGKKYIVTGGSSGLGKAMAKSLVAEGARVIITGRDADKLNEVAAEIKAEAFHADVTNEAAVVALFDHVKKSWGTLDGLVNNAGIGDYWAEVDQIDLDEMRRIFEINVFGATRMGSYAAGLFKAQKFGDLVNIASTASTKGFKMGSVYAASKFALRGLTECWQAELRPFNVRVIQINPSEVPTAFNVASREEKALVDKKLSPQEIADVLIASLKMDPRGFIPEVSVFATNPF